jgi:hypothetical protein
MGLSALLLVQALTSLAPTLANVSSLPLSHELESQRIVLPAAGPPEPDFLMPAVTGPQQQAIRLSDGYYTRLDIHRYAGYAVIPLFVLEYVAGQKLLTKGSEAPLWAEKVHKPAAYAVAGIFTLNTVTGLWNFVEAGKVKQGKKRRTWHTVLMLAADAGFIYSAAKAPSTSKIDARIAAGKVGGWTPHKASAIASMSVSTLAYLMMYGWKGEK